MSSAAALVWCPFGDKESAVAVIETLLNEKLIACANILPGVTSVYRWQGAVAQDEEVGVLCKTRAELLDAATQRIAELHPYETPAVLGWIAGSTPDVTLEWLAGEVQAGTGA